MEILLCVCARIGRLVDLFMAVATALAVAVPPAIAADRPEVDQLSRQAAVHFTAGRYREALELLEKAQTLRLETLGPESAEGIEGARRIAVLWEKMGESVKAGREFERLLSVSARVLGEGHAGTVVLLGNLGASLAHQGLYAQALPINEKAYRQLRELHGERDPKTLTAQSNYAANLGRIGRDAEAIKILESNVALRTAAQGPSAPGTLHAMSELSARARSAGHSGLALDVATRCVAQSARLPDYQPEKLSCALQRAHALNGLARHSESIDVFRAAIDVAERQYGSHHWATLSARSGLADALARTGQREDAVKLSWEVWETSRRALGEDHPSTQVYLGEYADTLQEAGRIGEALSIMRGRLASAKGTLGEEHVVTLGARKTIANYLARLGRQGEALAEYEALYEVTRRALGFKHDLTLQTQRSVAHMYQQFGRYREAAGLYSQGLKDRTLLFGEASPQTISLMSDLAGVLAQLGRLEESVSLAKRAFELRVRLAGENSVAAATQSEQYAVILSRAGKHEEATRLAAKAVEVRRANLGEDHPQTLEALTSLGLVFTKAGRHRDAIASYERVLESQVRVLGEVHPRTLVTLNNLVLPYAYSDRDSDAARVAKRAIEVAERLRSEQVVSPESRQAFVAQWSNLYRNQAILAAKAGDLDGSFRATELVKARTLLESSLLRDAAVALPADAQAELSRIEAEIATLNERLALQGRQPGLRALIEADKNRKVAQLRSAWQSFLVRHPELESRVQSKTVTVREIQAQVPADVAVLSFVLFDDQALVYVITRESSKGLKTPVHAGLTDSLRALRELLGRRTVGGVQRGPSVWKLDNGAFVAAAQRPSHAVGEVTDSSEIAEFVGSKLLAPIYPVVAAKTRWIVSPDAELSLVPLEVLRVDGAPVLRRHDVSVIPALSMYPLLARREREYSALVGRKALLAMGGADYGTHPVQLKGVSPRPLYTIEEISKLIKLRSGNEDETARGFHLIGARWLPLPGSEREVEAIAALFPTSDVTLLKREAATEERLRALNDAGELQNYRFLHFAAHGYLSTVEPALSSLVLGATPAVDGYVTAADWARYRLRSDLVVLSACNTGIGKVVRGEGIVGLPYALFLAGARNTLMTLWPVHDAATAEFMTRFFERLRQGQTQAGALAQTKREFMKHPQYSREEFWAPFVLYGT